MRLSDEQVALLTWLNEQPEPVSQIQMEDLGAPFYTSQRVKDMRNAGLIQYTQHVNFHGELYCVYSISDQGKAVLSELEEKRQQRAEEERRYEIQRQQADLQNVLSAKQTRLTLIQTIIAVASFITGLFCEHYLGLLDLLFRWFG